MNLHSQEKRILVYWAALLLLSFVSYRLIDGGGSTALLFAFVFVKLERIWNVYLEIGRGPKLFQAGVLAATLILMVTFVVVIG